MKVWGIKNGLVMVYELNNSFTSWKVRYEKLLYFIIKSHVTDTCEVQKQRQRYLSKSEK